MTAVDLLHALHQAGVVLAAKGDRLTYDAPAGVMTEQLRALLVQNKPVLLALLDGASAAERTSRTSEGEPASTMRTAWFRPGATARAREQFAYGPETKTHPAWWDYLYEVHSRGLVVVAGKVVDG